MAAIAPVLVSGIVDPAGVILTTSATVASDRTFSPEGFKQAGVAKWVDRAGGIAIGYPAFTMSIRPPTQTSRMYKVTAKVVIPTLEQTSPSTSSGIQPAPTKAYDCTCVMEWMLPERSTLLERQTLLSNVKSLLVRTINANDGAPSSTTGSPLELAVTTFEDVY
jgi:hypothetical protein